MPGFIHYVCSWKNADKFILPLVLLSFASGAPIEPTHMIYDLENKLDRLEATQVRPYPPKKKVEESNMRYLQACFPQDYPPGKY